MILMIKRVLLKINGEEVPLNRYAASVFLKINWALIETLKGIDLENIQTTEITIVNEE